MAPVPLIRKIPSIALGELMSDLVQVVTLDLVMKVTRALHVTNIATR